MCRKFWGPHQSEKKSTDVSFLELCLNRKMLKVQHVTLADQDLFIWTLPTPRDAHLAFVLGQPATVAAQIIVEPRCTKDFFSFLS